MGKRLLAALTVIGLLGFTGGTATAQGIDRKEIQQELDRLTQGGGELGAQARVIDGRERFGARSGVAELGTTKPVPLDGRFRVGSITKTFVSVVVLQLAGEGELRLDAPVERYLPGLLKNNEITVRQILQHTSGLFNYVNAIPLEPEDFEQIRYRHWEPAELVAISTSRPLDFPPGTKFGYANTNFVVAGLLVEKLTGRSLEHAIEKRILNPLRLNNTVMPGDRVGIPGPHAHGYYTVAGKPTDVTRQNGSLVWAAGDLISTTADLDTFVTALAGGRLLKQAQQAELTKTTAAAPDYGLGFVVRTLPCGVTIWGHNGGLYGFGTDMYTTPDTSTRLVSSYTSAPSPGSGENSERLINAAFC